MKIRKTNIKDKAGEQKVKAWKLLCLKAFGEESSVEALRAIIDIAERDDIENVRN